MDFLEKVKSMREKDANIITLTGKEYYDWLMENSKGKMLAIICYGYIPTIDGNLINAQKITQVNPNNFSYAEFEYITTFAKDYRDKNVGKLHLLAENDLSVLNDDIVRFYCVTEDYICWNSNYYVEDFAIVITDGESLFGDRQLARELEE